MDPATRKSWEHSVYWISMDQLSSPNHLASQREQYDWGVVHFQGQIEHPKFKMFFAVHEIEAWILSQPKLFPDAVRNGFPGKVEEPESVNFDEPPSKLLHRLYRTYTREGYRKIVDGNS